MPEFLLVDDILRQHILDVLNKAEADGVSPEELWVAINAAPYYDFGATRTLRPRVSEDGIEEGSEGAPNDVPYEYQEPTPEWGEFVAGGDHFFRSEDGKWAVRQ